jgi:predicted transcriptional regulator
MELLAIKELLKCDVLNGEDNLSMNIETVIASDGMSEILAFACPHALMVTSLTNIQSVRTARMADAQAILYIRGKQPEERALAYARQYYIPVLVTKMGVFDVCGILREHGLKGGM